MIDVKKYVPFIVENRLTQEQFLLMYLVHQREYKLIQMYKDRFTNTDDTMISQRQIDDLIERGFIKVQGENADEVEITNKFTRIFEDTPNLNLPLPRDLYNAANEFWRTYPPYVENDGKRFPLTLMDKNEFRKLYMSRINFDLEEHKQVMEDLEYAKENNLIFGKIEMFIKSEQWERIREVRGGHLEISEFNTEQSHDF